MSSPTPTSAPCRASTRWSTSWLGRCRTRRRPRPPPPDELTELPPFHSTMPKGGFHAAVEAAKEYILAGDIFQVVLAQRFDLDERYDPFDVYRVLRQVNPSPYMYFLRHPEATLVGS